MNAVQTRRLTQEMADTYQRALTGGPFYAAAWLLVGIYGDAFSRAPLASWGLLLGFIGLSAWRFMHRPIHVDDEATVVRWLRLHWGIVLFTTALWGGLFCWATLDSGFGAARITALLFTLGLATAIAHAFSMRRGFAFAGIVLLCLPGLFLLWINPADRANALMMVTVPGLRGHLAAAQLCRIPAAAGPGPGTAQPARPVFAAKPDRCTDRAGQPPPVRRRAGQRRPQQAKRSGEPLTLLLLDIDHFKHINDTHGHTIGDACLMAIAGRLKTSFSGEGDLAARVGGEEFGVVLGGQDLAAATLRAERFRASLAEHPIALDGITLTMTASIGLAEFDATLHENDDALYHAADSAVYRAKAAGRNRVCREEPGLALASESL